MGYPAATGRIEGLAELAGVIAAGSVSYLTACVIRSLRGRRRRTSTVRVRPRPLALLGLSVLVSATASARERRPGIPHRSAPLSQLPPWSEPGGYFPPHPPGRAGADAPIPMPTDTLPAPVHADSESDLPGATRTSSTDSSLPAPVRADSKDRWRLPRIRPPRRSAGPMPRKPRGAGTWLVAPGDSLWSIAARYLETDDQGRVARYWPRIHRANRSKIGRDPNLIHPGQVLVMPAETDAAG